MRGLAPAVGILLGAATPALAQEAEAPQGDERPPELVVLKGPAAEPDRITVNAGATAVSQYISRGVAFSDRPSLQVFVTVRAALPELTGGAVTDASVSAGTWNSVQNGGPGLGQRSTGALSWWYETDIYAGATVELQGRWTVSATYYRYESPSNSFRGYNDLELIVRFNDERLWDGLARSRGFRLSPALRLVHEVGRPGRADALYAQPSLTPSFTVGGPDHDVRIAVPLAAGFSDDYYLDASGRKQAFGFFRTGIALSGAPFPDAAAGLKVNGGIDVWLLNDRVANGLNDAEVVGRIGSSWRF